MANPATSLRSDSRPYRTKRATASPLPKTHRTEFLANPATSLRPNSRPYRTK
ncbi:hypothetical protein RB2235 [Rhodopirellula baltica SH 1]|uniref:Uncharacterized protein n=1 Tax=Rhodopirellula baltica (strain DSM 10527 / NCIMB 13988 / SH1) TaxID=243090 RepID=Q7UW68_RHOBA|nr:hypothetical protein RB2235 [Rhodopirellula baltica SH 1]